MLPLTGYADKWSAAPGETVAFKVSSTSELPCSARLVRVICGDPNPEGPGIREEDLSARFETRFPARYQAVHLGSYGTAPVPATSLERGFTLLATIWPTTPRLGRAQGIFGNYAPDRNLGIALAIDEEGRLVGQVGDGRQSLLSVKPERRLHPRQWYDIWLSVDPVQRHVTIGQIPLTPNYGFDLTCVTNAKLPYPAALGHGDITFAAFGGEQPSGHYNGKLERPRILGRPVSDEEMPAVAQGKSRDVLVADWDFSLEMERPWHFFDCGPEALHGELKNLPARAMTGSNWTGEVLSWQQAPDQYGAIHFHDDDLYDCEWKTDFSFTVPGGMKSGAYAMRLKCGEVEDMIPFYVRPPRGQRQAPLCLLIPTFTYTVYANHARGNTDDAYRAIVAQRNARPWTPDEHPDYALSTYNHHSDGSGICYASRRRPMITMGSGFVTFSEPFSGSGLRHYPADTHILNWLKELGQEFDVVTDHDLDAEGVDLIAGYRTVMTATHPEYHTLGTWQAVHDYVGGGGHLMYLGGNGFYWRVATHSEADGCIEVRRAEGGIRAWAAEPGEYFHAFDGKYGGLWRRNGRPPQIIVGIGFSAQGKFQGSYYRRGPGAVDPRTAWIFEGVEDELIGDFGLFGGGAAGFELDRVDYRLGSPDDIVILASSEKYADHFILVPEEQLTHITTWPGEPVSRLLRADMTYFEVPGGGKVFSAGSITYCGSLCHNGYDNNIARLTGNVLRRFLDTAE